MAKNGTLLWIDDEIELLRAHILFLKGKEYEVDTATNGRDALDRCRERSYDLILLDENMPGLTGLETLTLIKEVQPTVPVVMVTKSEEEDIMNQAIGMDHFNSRRKVHGSTPIATAHSAKIKSKNGTKTLTTGKQAVAHRFKQKLLRFVRIVELFNKIFLDKSTILIASQLKLPIHDPIPPLQAVLSPLRRLS